MGIKITKNDVIWGYIGTFLVLGINFMLIPILMFFLSDELLGLWQVFTSLGSIALLLDFGFSPTLARNVAYIWSGAEELKSNGIQKITGGNTNYYLLASVIQVCKYTYFIIAVFAVTILSTIGTLYIRKISGDISEYYYLIAWTIYILAIFLNLFYYYYSAALLGIGAVKENNQARAWGCISQIIICFILSIFKFGIIAPALAYLSYGLVYRGLAKKFFYKQDNLKEKLSIIEKKTSIKQVKELFFIIWHNAWRDGIVALANYLISQANTIICSFYFTLAETGIYSISLQFVTAIGVIASVMFTAYQPKLQAACINDDKSTMQNIMAFSTLTYDFIFFLGMITLIVLGLPILKIINPTYDFDILIIIVMGIYMFLQKRYSLFTSYYSSTNRLPYVKAFIFSGILSVLLSWLFCAFFHLEIWGLVLGQLFAQLVFNDWYWPMKAKKELNITSIDMVKKTINLRQNFKK